jgi:APA family basic amino acid/polyamine antiporter
MSTESHKLSLWAAIFININIMIGIGLFVNTTVLAQSLGAFGWAAYAALAVLLLPLILSIAKLVELYPSGGFYTYARESLHPFAGFVSAWCYFTAKLASATLMIHTSVQLLQQIIPVIAQINPFALDLLFISLFIGLNMFHMRAGKSVQVVFLCMKLVPILFVLLTGLFLFSVDNLSAATLAPMQFVGAIPLVLFAALGFEATTSLSNNIKDAKRNGPRAILISYLIVVSLNILYQLFFYGVVGSALAQANNFLQAFPLLINSCCGGGSLASSIQNICNIAIASSALGGAFGILFSNSWNLHTLALNGHIINPKFFLKENRFGIPFACILAEGAIFLIYLIGTHGSQIPLQQIAAFGSSIAYSLSILSLLVITLSKKAHNTPSWIPFFGIVNCIFFLASCLNSFYTRGASSLYLYSAVLIAGITMYIITRKS